MRLSCRRPTSEESGQKGKLKCLEITDSWLLQSLATLAPPSYPVKSKEASRCNFSGFNLNPSESNLNRVHGMLSRIPLLEHMALEFGDPSGKCGREGANSTVGDRPRKVRGPSSQAGGDQSRVVDDHSEVARAWMSLHPSELTKSG